MIAAGTSLSPRRSKDPLTRRALEASSVIPRSRQSRYSAAMLEGRRPRASARAHSCRPPLRRGRPRWADRARRRARGDRRLPPRRRNRSSRVVYHRRAAWRELRDEVRDAPPTELWRYTADMLYLIENPVVREAFVRVGRSRSPSSRPGPTMHPRSQGSPTATSRPRRLRSSTRHGGTRSRAPSRSFATATVSSRASSPCCRPEAHPPAHGPSRGPDRVEKWARHLHENPVPTGQVVLGLRRWLDVERGELPCASQAACWLDVKRAYMALRPALRRMYVVVHDVPTYWPVVEKLGFRTVAESGPRRRWRSPVQERRARLRAWIRRRLARRPGWRRAGCRRGTVAGDGGILGSCS